MNLPSVLVLATLSVAASFQPVCLPRFGVRPLLPARAISPCRIGIRIVQLRASEDSADSKDASLLERLGGDAALDAAVQIFYDKLLEDDSLSKYMAGVDIPSLREHQKNFMRIAFTGVPKDLDVSDLMLVKHGRLFTLGLDEKDFDTTAGHLVATLEELSVPDALIQEVVAVVGPLRGAFERGAMLAAKSLP